MLIARAPVRISFAGGGTDLEAYYGRYGGLVVSAAIDKYFYVFLNPTGGGNIQVTSSDYRTFYRHNVNRALIWDGDLALPKAILHEFGLREGLSMFLASEIPPGTGLGSSSAVAVAIIKALATLCDRPMSRQEIAELACHIEIDKLGMPIGKQDQYAAAFGGLNAITFGKDRVEVEPPKVSGEVLGALERRIMLFFTGAARHSTSILARQKRSSEREDAEVIESLHAIKAAAQEMRACLEKGDLGRFGQLLDEAWQQKKRLAKGITNPRIDACYALAREKGALGGKITGAGGGGFLMLYCEEPQQEAVTQALEALGLARMDLRFDFSGARVLMNAARVLTS